MVCESTGTLTKTHRRLFYGLAVALLWIGSASACVQKRCEGAVAMSMASHLSGELKEAVASDGNVKNLVWMGQCWEIVGLAAVGLALLSCGVALFRRETLRWVWTAVPLLLYISLELIMV